MQFRAYLINAILIQFMAKRATRETFGAGISLRVNYFLLIIRKFYLRFCHSSTIFKPFLRSLSQKLQNFSYFLNFSYIYILHML